MKKCSIKIVESDLKWVHTAKKIDQIPRVCDMELGVPETFLMMELVAILAHVAKYILIARI